MSFNAKERPKLQLEKGKPEMKRATPGTAVRMVPDIISIDPPSIPQGETRVVTIRKKNMAATATLFFGSDISQAGPPIPGDHFKIPISVSPGCSTGMHEVIIRQNGREYTRHRKTENYAGEFFGRTGN